MKMPLPTWLVPLMLAAAATSALAQDDTEKPAFYRVEAIVFTHAGGQPDAWPVGQPSNHAGAHDPAWRSFARQQELDRAETEASGDDELRAALSMVETLASLESGEESLTEALLYPEPWLSLDELSEPMARAKARLEQSGAFRVRTWLAWHQPLDDDGRARAVRLHDDRPIAVDWIGLSPTGRLLRRGRPARSAEDLAPDFHYRLDGTLRLRQRQFMHADIILDWRTPQLIGPSPWPFLRQDAELEVHRLEQSRTIRPDRFEYFDSEWLGLLLRVTRFEPRSAGEDIDEPAEPANTP